MAGPRWPRYQISTSACAALVNRDLVRRLTAFRLRHTKKPYEMQKQTKPSMIPLPFDREHWPLPFDAMIIDEYYTNPIKK